MSIEEGKAKMNPRVEELLDRLETFDEMRENPMARMVLRQLRAAIKASLSEPEAYVRPHEPTDDEIEGVYEARGPVAGLAMENVRLGRVPMPRGPIRLDADEEPVLECSRCVDVKAGIGVDGLYSKIRAEDFGGQMECPVCHDGSDLRVRR